MMTLLQEKLQILDPLTMPDWDKRLLRTPGYSIFHTSQWAKVMHATYGFKCYYLAIPDQDHFELLVPVMEANSLLTAKRGISLPFSDHCFPIIPPAISADALKEAVLELGKQQGWESLEFRGWKAYLPNEPVTSTYYHHLVDLTPERDALWKGLRKNYQRNIRKAQKNDVTVRFGNQLDQVRAYYHLHCLTRKRQGVPPQPFKLFEMIHREMIAEGNGTIALAYHQRVPVAGALYLHFGEHVMYKFGAWDMRYKELRPNNLLWWEAFLWFKNQGFTGCCLGKTDSWHSSLRHFKNGWNAKEDILVYHEFNYKQNRFLDRDKGTPSFLFKLFKHCPISCLRRIGELFYKHAA